MIYPMYIFTCKRSFGAERHKRSEPGQQPARPFVKTKSMKKKALTRDKTRRKGGSSHRTGGLKMRTALGGESNGTLSQRVYQALKKDIITGQYQPGEALSEKALAKRYHGSRTPVREAAVRLQQEHLVRIVANRGYFITHITIQWVNELYEFQIGRASCRERCRTRRS